MDKEKEVKKDEEEIKQEENEQKIKQKFQMQIYKNLKMTQTIQQID